MFNLIQLIVALIRQSQKNSQNSANSSSNGSDDAQFSMSGFNMFQFPKSKAKKYKNLPIWAKVLIAFLFLIAILIVVLAISVLIVPPILWYSQMGYGNVWWIKVLVPIIVFVVGTCFGVFVTWVSLALTFKLRPKYALSTLSVSQMEDIKKSIAQKRRLIFLCAGLITGIFFGLSLLPGVDEFLLLFGSNSFGVTDPIFHNDVSFYVFQLPGIERIIGSVIALFAIMMVFAIIEGSIFGQIAFKRVKTKIGSRTSINVSNGLRSQIAVYFGFILLLVASEVYLGRYNLLTNLNDRITGAGWTDVNVRIPVITFISALLVITALISFFGAFAKVVKPLLISGTSILTVILILGVFAPSVVQSLKVSPNAQELERPYIQNNIDATKMAFSLNNVEIEQYNASTDAKAGALKNDAETTASIRLLDPQIVAPTFRQLQQNKQYYGFQDTLSVDKYSFDNKSHDTVIAARELDLSGNSERNWVNDHTVYTHGYGLVAAYGNSVTSDGRPAFFEKDIPVAGDLTKKEPYQPRIYFSKNLPDYSVVGSNDNRSWEFDYPDSKEGTVKFNGNGGPKLSNPIIKLIYALRFGSYQMLFSDRVNSGSQILYDRDPSQRVQKVAPYLTIDGRVYPASVDGHIKWIVDAYTTTDRYPYSSKVDLGAATKDTLTETSSSISNLDSKVANYVRNSVKATVDAYDGSVDLYAWDANDPVLKAWAKIYGQNLKPLSKISGGLMSHIRYPENLFKVQRSLLSKYHVSDSQAFFSGEDFWQVPQDPTTSGIVNTKDGIQETGVKQPPYYLTLQMPNVSKPIFSLTSSFIPGGGSRREILTGFLSADSDAGNEAGKIGENYGKLRLLQLPKNTTVPGPGQAQNNFNSNADVSKELNLLSSGSSRVQRGNLLTLPIGGGLVYVQPVYVQSTGSTSFPLLKKILVAFGDKVGFANTLDEALNQIFSGDSGVDVTANVTDENGDPLDKATETNTQGQSTTTQTSSQPNVNNDSSSDKITLDEAKKALEQAKDAIEKAQKALDDAVASQSK